MFFVIYVSSGQLAVTGTVIGQHDWLKLQQVACNIEHKPCHAHLYS